MRVILLDAADVKMLASFLQLLIQEFQCRHSDVPLHELSVDRLVDRLAYVRVVDGVLDFCNLSITHRQQGVAIW
tara:strand:+ start:426 stop:647 length:222 start_codon:yes stop_codon:yes gene_type:complete